MIYLLDSSRCPSCGIRGSVRLDSKRCTACNRDLFRAEDSVDQFELETGLRASWVWFDPSRQGHFRGWVHATKLHDPRPNAPEFKLSDRAPKPVEVSGG